MIAFRQVDARYPFVWEDPAQPPGRWHGAGEGPAHCFADTPDGAWAEFLRHEEITDPRDLATVRRRMWAVDIGDAPATVIGLRDEVATGGLDTYAQCQAEARRLRASGVARLVAPSAALERGGARGLVVDGGVHLARPRDSLVLVVFEPAGSLVGWIAAAEARPADDLLQRVRHYPSTRT